jgi:predicted Zn-ribbon and HTH transcriptional regulator
MSLALPSMKTPKPPATAPDRRQTVRASLRAELVSGERTAAGLSSAVGIREKDVAEHLEHLAKSLQAEGGRLIVTPAECLKCGFRFKTRKRLTTPGRCPQCSSERIGPAAFSIEPCRE